MAPKGRGGEWGHPRRGKGCAALLSITSNKHERRADPRQSLYPFRPISPKSEMAEVRCPCPGHSSTDRQVCRTSARAVVVREPDAWGQLWGQLEAASCRFVGCAIGRMPAPPEGRPASCPTMKGSQTPGKRVGPKALVSSKLTPSVSCLVVPHRATGMSRSAVSCIGLPPRGVVVAQACRRDNCRSGY